MSILGWYPFPYQGMYPSSYKSMYPSPYKGIYPSSYKGMYPSPNQGLFPRLLYSSIANIPLNPLPCSPATLYSCFMGRKRLRTLLLPYIGELPAGLRGTACGLLLSCSHIILYTSFPYPIPPSGYFPYIGEELDTCLCIIHSPLSTGEGSGERPLEGSGERLRFPCSFLWCFKVFLPSFLAFSHAALRAS